MSEDSMSMGEYEEAFGYEPEPGDEALALKEEAEGEAFQQQAWLIEEYERALEDQV